MSFVGQAESDMKSVANNMITNCGAMFLWSKFISDLVPKSESEIINAYHTEESTVNGCDNSNTVLYKSP